MRPLTRHIRREMKKRSATADSVIVLLDRTIQYAAPFQFHSGAGDYWMPRLRGA
jgi:hypothetical protein